ncbi:MAG: AAA family ATPase [Trueperaceae bacterium]|nr:AAA family ATPase [Trueperaceae bacterium]
MKRILITGMSGTGKSSLLQALSKRGYKTVDTDYGYTLQEPDGGWVWREEAIQTLLSTEDAEVLFLSGTVSNQGKFYPQFDRVILLSVPKEIMLERLKTRSTNSFGKSAKELGQILADLEAIEPLLRQGADYEIDTNKPLEQVVDEVLQLL